MKKAQSISINTIVVAIIALLVLVIVVFVFGKQIGDWFETTNTCETAGGSCTEGQLQLGDGCDREGGYALVPGARCEPPNPTANAPPCCRKVVFDE